MPLKLSTRHDPLPTAIGAAAPQARNRPGPVRPRTLIAARWIALAGQAAAVAGAWALGARFPLAPVALVMAAAVVMNLRLGTGPHRGDDRHAIDGWWDEGEHHEATWTTSEGGGYVAVEVKRRGEIDGVEQLTRYLALMNADPLMAPVRGVFAAQLIKPQARTLAGTRGIACLSVDYDVLRGAREADLTLF